MSKAVSDEDGGRRTSDSLKSRFLPSTHLTRSEVARKLSSTGASRRPAGNRTAGGFFSRRRRSSFLSALLLIAACTGAPLEPDRRAPSPSPEPSHTPVPTPSPTPTTPIEPTSQPSSRALRTGASPPRSCSEAEGVVLEEELQEADLGRSLPVRIYLPPCYSPGGATEYPVLYLLHGLGSDASQWEQLGATQIADRLVTNGEALPFLIVMPWTRTGLDVEKAIVEVLVPFVDLTYSHSSSRHLRAIGGLSRGAGWAFRIGFQYPEVFGAIGMHSPAVLEADRSYLFYWVRDLSLSRLPRIWIDVGEQDSLFEPASSLRTALEDQGLLPTWNTGSGAHTEHYWRENMESYLRWYTQPWRPGAAAPPGPSP